MKNSTEEIFIPDKSIDSKEAIPLNVLDKDAEFFILKLLNLSDFICLQFSNILFVYTALSPLKLVISKLSKLTH